MMNEFEIAADAAGLNTRKCSDGSYFYQDTQDAHYVWQAARASCSETPDSWTHKLNSCRFHDDDRAACATYSGQVPCDAGHIADDSEMVASDNREAFELFVQSEFPHIKLTRKGDTGEYLYKTAHFAWSAWQASRAQGDAEPVAYISHTSESSCLDWFAQFDAPRHTPLYTHPPKAQAVPESIEAAIYMLEDYASALENGDLDGAGHSTTSCIHEVIDQLATAPQPPQEGLGDA